QRGNDDVEDQGPVRAERADRGVKCCRDRPDALEEEDRNEILTRPAPPVVGEQSLIVEGVVGHHHDRTPDEVDRDEHEEGRGIREQNAQDPADPYAQRPDHGAKVYLVPNFRRSASRVASIVAAMMCRTCSRVAGSPRMASARVPTWRITPAPCRCR